MYQCVPNKEVASEAKLLEARVRGQAVGLQREVREELGEEGEREVVGTRRQGMSSVEGERGVGLRIGKEGPDDGVEHERVGAREEGEERGGEGRGGGGGGGEELRLTGE